MKNYIFFFLLSNIIVLQAQNITQKTIPGKGISTISIHGEMMYKITVEARPVTEIIIHSRVEGENNENIVLVTKRIEDNLEIATKYQPLFEDANDKLSAHKVISVAVNLVVPEYLNLVVDQYNSDFIAIGRYSKVVANSNAGNCTLNAYQGNAKIITRNGNITIQTNHAAILATTKNGSIQQDEIESGTNTVLIKTINGNIFISRS